MFCVCYTCDNNYALQVGVAIYSLYDNNRDLPPFDTILFSDGISDENKARLKSIAAEFDRNLDFIESTHIIDFIKGKGIAASVDDGALSTYVRLFLGNYIDERYDRIIYIDADTLVLDSIRELTEIEMTNPAAAVIDIMPYDYRKLIGFADSYYFNCGVLVMDTKKWREEDFDRQLLERIEDSPNRFLFGDQDIFNIVLRDKVTVLPIKYNLFPYYGRIKYENMCMFVGKEAKYYSKPEFEYERKTPCIIHMVYSVADRPWVKGNINEYSERWVEYVKKTPWKTFPYKTRKFYSRTRIMQWILKIFGEKAEIRVEVLRNKKKFAKARKKIEEYDQKNR
ncbi:MAG: glycosyltransferase family 8 protein [Lachnospiraceae bacterium]|nr:glycosyltransferase family 8 protein [Lachnospiraceae bacterium]